MNDGNKENGIVENLIWSYGERMGAQIVTLVVSLVLARIIAPEEFAVISLVSIFITFADVLVTDGLGSVLVQRDDVGEDDFSTMLWFSEIIALVLYIGIFFISPFVASFFKQDKLCLVMRVMGIRIPIAAINSIQRAHISRNMQFKKFFFSTLVGTVMSGICGVIMALLGFGVWAIVAQYLINSFVDTVFLSFVSNFAIRFKIQKNRLRLLLPFGIRIVFVSLMTTLYSNIRNLIIGKKYTSTDLAFCDKGQTFPSLITVNISASITGVIFPVMSRLQGKPDKLLEMMRRCIRLGSYLLSPLLLGLAAVGEQFILVLLGNKWIESVPYLQIMCMVYLLQPIQQASIQAMKAVGEAGVYVKSEIIKKLLGLLVLVLAIIFADSVKDIVFSALIAEIISTVINFPINKRLLKYKYIDQIIDIFCPIFMSVVMWVIVSIVANTVCISIKSNLITLAIEVIVGGVFYVLISKIFNIKEFDYVVSKINSQLLHRKEG